MNDRNRTMQMVGNAAGAIGLLLVAIALGYVLVSRSWDIARIILVAALGLLTIFVWMNPEAIGRAVNGRGTRYGANTLLRILVALGIAILLYAIWVLLAPRISAGFGRLDLTANKQFTLSNLTAKTLTNLPKPVQAIGFFRADSEGSLRLEADNLLKEYRARSEKFTYRFVDPLNDPLTARQYNLTRTGVVIFDDGTKRETASANSDQEFVAALLRLQETSTKTIAVLDVQSLISFDAAANAQQRSLALIKTELTNQSYKFLDRPYNLAISPTISITDVTVLIVPPVLPTQPLKDTQVQAISNYLDAGGHVLLMGDPEAAPLPAALLGKYGLSEYHGVVTDSSIADRWALQGQPQPFNLLVKSYGSSLITRDMGNKPTLYSISTAIQLPTSPVAGFTTSPVVQSSTTATVQKIVVGADGRVSLEVDPSAPTAPLSLIVSVESSAPGITTSITGTTTSTVTHRTRLIVSGDADFASDDLTQITYDNRDLFTNIINWLSGSEGRISVSPPPTTNHQLTLSADQQNIVFYSSVLFLPVLVLLLGGYIWWRRR